MYKYNKLYNLVYRNRDFDANWQVVYPYNREKIASEARPNWVEKKRMWWPRVKVYSKPRGSTVGRLAIPRDSCATGPILAVHSTRPRNDQASPRPTHSIFGKWEAGRRRRRQTCLLKDVCACETANLATTHNCKLTTHSIRVFIINKANYLETKMQANTDGANARNLKNLN